MMLLGALEISPRQAAAALGAVRTVVEADGEPRERGRELLELAVGVLGQGEDWRAIPAAKPSEVVEAFDSPRARHVLVDALLVPACIEGEVTVAGEAAVRSFAVALGVRSHWVGVLGAMRRRRVLAVKRQLASRSPDARRLFARTWEEDGLVGIWRAVRFVLGRYEDPALAARFRALAALPEGTLGRQLHDDLRGRDLSFPGERGGLPERMIHHDLMHVVNGYGTDAAGECELAGFYTGFCSRSGSGSGSGPGPGVGDAFTFIVIVLATFHLELPVSPAAITPARGAFDPARVLAAFLRGRQLHVDVMGPWDYWALMPLPLPEVRERLGIA